MGAMKDFAMSVSISLGYEGILNEDIIDIAFGLLRILSDDVSIEEKKLVRKELKAKIKKVISERDKFIADWERANINNK